MLLVEGLLGLIAFLLGAALFSFMNVVAWRLPRGKNPLTGRSFCPQCGAALTAGDLVPVFSWLFLRGRCRHCRAPIPVRYLLVELLGGVLALGCRWRFGTAYTLGEGLFGMRWQGLLALALCGVLLSIALIDAETQLIPNRLNAAVAVLAVLNLLLSPARWAGALIGMVCISVPMLLLCLAIPGAFGGGDIKLMAAAGLFLGWQHTLLAMFFGILGGGFYGMYLLAARKADKKDHFAFGPLRRHCAGAAFRRSRACMVLPVLITFHRNFGGFPCRVTATQPRRFRARHCTVSPRPPAPKRCTSPCGSKTCT